MAESVTPHPAIEAKREKESFAEEHLRNVAQVHPPYSYMNTPSRGEHTSFMRRHTIASAKDTKTTRRTRNFYAKTTIANANAPQATRRTRIFYAKTHLCKREKHTKYAMDLQIPREAPTDAPRKTCQPHSRIAPPFFPKYRRTIKTRLHTAS